MARLLQEYVDGQARDRPDQVAIVMRDDRLTYGELGQESDRLARVLRDAGCTRGDRVCLLLPKSISAVVGMLGTLKSGCAYVPLDVGSPARRLALIIESVEPRSILVDASALPLLTEILSQLPDAIRERMQVGWLDADPPTNADFRPSFSRGDVEGASSTTLASDGVPTDAAHILFTSGSTGQPKGVSITHANVTHFVSWANEYFQVSASDRVSGLSPFHFDLSTYDIYGAFAAGATLFLVPPELNLMASRLADFIRQHELTQWFSVPTILNYMAKFDVVKVGDFPALKRILWCGEVFPTPTVRYWMERLPHVAFTNLYGPTEATIASSYFTMPKPPESDTDAIPIGQACPGEELLVLDGSMGAVSQGEIGDLYIAGAGLSPGYWRDNVKTAAAFGRHPTDASERVYRTGDLASRGPDGMVYFHGRSDSQIKSRGYRIELGEIEAALNSIADLREAAVVALDGTDFGGAVICCAYVPVTGPEVTSASISAKLRRLVPGYMVPTRWSAFDSLPRNLNGKFDRRALKDHFADGPA